MATKKKKKHFWPKTFWGWLFVIVSTLFILSISMNSWNTNMDILKNKTSVEKNNRISEDIPLIEEGQTITKNGYTVSEPKIEVCPRTDGYGKYWICSSVYVTSGKGFYEFMNFLYLYDEEIGEYYNRVPVGGGSTSPVKKSGIGASFYIDCSEDKCKEKSFYLIYVANEGTAPSLKDMKKLSEKDYTYVFEVTTE